MSLQVTMQNFQVVKIVNSQGNLCEPIEDLRFSEILPFLFHLFNFGVHISLLAVNHYDAEVAFIVGE